jgi:hypothetical protein
MTANELLKHPEYDHIIRVLKPEKKGKVAVAKGRGGPIDIAYELHGHGERHLVVSTLFAEHYLSFSNHGMTNTMISRTSAWLLAAFVCNVLFQPH